MPCKSRKTLPRHLLGRKIFMPKHHILDTSLSSLVFKSLFDLYSESEFRRECCSISDLAFAQLGVLRCFSSEKTGQGFLQLHADEGVADIDPGHFFKALKSKRRLKNITSLNNRLSSVFSEKIHDPFAQFKELSNWKIYAVDGHYHKAACFDSKKKNSKGDLVKYATGHFFRVNLRNHHLSSLAMSEPKDGKKKEHDMAVIKRCRAEELRYEAGKGEITMLVWDKACIDYMEWENLKHKGIRFITMEKSNSAAEVVGELPFNKKDPRNEGIVSDQLVGVFCGVEALRRIVYINPEDGKKYTYLTNEIKTSAFLLVLMYKLRWDIEKIFYQLKSKMEERKSWGTPVETKKAHAMFECIAHNLALLLEDDIKKSEGIHDEVEVEKSVARLKSKESKKNKKQSSYINTIVLRCSHRTMRFIRWLRNKIYRSTPLSQSLARLRELWTTNRS